jgi:release factor glutamine methyltransferase
LLAHAHGVTPEALLRDPAAPADMTSLVALVARREAHEPLALIVGHREFWSLEFAVSPATLIPRPESETLIEAAIAAFANREPPQLVLDLGTGTGCLLLAALSEFPAAVGIGVDRSAEAAALAAGNAAALHLADRALFMCGDWTDALSARFDLVLGNPPYIPTADLAGLMPEVALYEPRTALDGGKDGATAYRQLVPGIARMLTPTGVAVLEIGADQAETAIGLARRTGLATELCPDLRGFPRALVLRQELP